MGKERDGGLRKLREELEAENSGVHTPAEVRWLGGQRSEPGSRKRRMAPLRWWPQSWAKRLSTAFADTESGSSEPDTVSTHVRSATKRLLQLV